MNDEAVIQKTHVDPNAPLPVSRNEAYRDPVIELYKKDIDRTLLRENLKLTVTQRFEKFERFMRYVAELKSAGRKARGEGQ